MQIVAYRKTHSMRETITKYPELCEKTVYRMMKEGRKLATKVHKGFAKQKRSRPLQKYREMGVAVDKFFREVRDAQGAVSRGLLDCFIPSLPARVTQDFFKITRSGRDEVWQRWRRFYGTTYRRISGVKQYIPGDYETRVASYNALLRSLNEQQGFRSFVCGDETRWR